MRHTTQRILPAAALLAVLCALPGCEQNDPPKPPGAGQANVTAVPPPDKVWTAAEVAADPQGYMKWADVQVGRQIDDRNARISSLSARLADVESRQKTLADNIADMINIANRMATALRRAEDEDRFPVQIAGRSYDKGEATAIIEKAKKYVEDRKSLAEAYDQAVSRLRGAVNVLTKEIDELNRLRERMALDLEAVRLSQSTEDLDKLRKSEARVTGFAKALGAMADDAIVGTIPEDQGKDKADIDKMLKKQ